MEEPGQDTSTSLGLKASFREMGKRVFVSWRLANKARKVLGDGNGLDVAWGAIWYLWQLEDSQAPV